MCGSFLSLVVWLTDAVWLWIWGLHFLLSDSIWSSQSHVVPDFNKWSVKIIYFHWCSNSPGPKYGRSGKRSSTRLSAALHFFQLTTITVGLNITIKISLARIAVLSSLTIGAQQSKLNIDWQDCENSDSILWAVLLVIHSPVSPGLTWGVFPIATVTNLVGWHWEIALQTTK